VPDDAAPAVPENVLALDSGLTPNDHRHRVVRSFGLQNATPEQRAAILRTPEVATYCCATLGPRWRWALMAEVAQQQAQLAKKHPQRKRGKA
jgi:hypothetical protein